MSTFSSASQEFNPQSFQVGADASNDALAINDVQTSARMSGSSLDAVLSQATRRSYEAMVAFSQREDAAAQMAVAFGAGYDVAAADQFFDSLVMGPGMLPQVEVLDDSILGGALGAYAQATDTVYVSRQFLESGNIDAITGVLIEEFGHGIDARVNAIDASGDEGEIFARHVLGVETGEQILDRLTTEEDAQVITAFGQDLRVEAHIVRREISLPTQNGSLVSVEGDPKVYVLRQGKLHWIQNAETFNTLGFKWDDIHQISRYDLRLVRKGEPLPTTLREGSILSAEGDPKVYVLREGKLRWIPDGETFAALGLDWNTLQQVSSGSLEGIEVGESLPVVREGSLLSAEGDPKVYVLRQGKLHWIPDPETFNILGFDWGAIQNVSSTSLQGMHRGEQLPPVREGSLLSAEGDPKVYVMKQGKLHWIPDPETFNILGFDWGAIQHVSSTGLQWMHKGEQLTPVREGSLLSVEGDPKVYALQEGKLRWIPDPETFEALGFDWDSIQEISDSNLQLIEVGESLQSVHASGFIFFNQQALIGSSVNSGIQGYASTAIPRILDAAQKAGISDKAQIAYILATARHESLFGLYMEEIASGSAYENRRDLGNIHRGDGVRFKGRGYVQITGRRNYQDWSNRLGIDLVADPEKAEDPQIAARILVEGMRDGTFTGKKLSDYVSEGRQNFVDARRIVNGRNKASLIAGYAQNFLGILNSSGYSSQQTYDAVDTVGEANQFFKTQFFHAQYNPDGPRSSGNCAPASLSIIRAMLGIETPGLSIQESINESSNLTERKRSDWTTFEEIKKGIRNSGGTSLLVTSKAQIDSALENGYPIIATGRYDFSWRHEFPEYSKTGNIRGSYVDHANVIMGKSQSGKYLVADPMYRGGVVEMNWQQLYEFFDNKGVHGYAFQHNLDVLEGQNNSSSGQTSERQPYVFKQNDTLFALAQRFLGNGNRWTEITKEDGSSFTEYEARFIPPGQTVYLPGSQSDNSGGYTQSSQVEEGVSDSSMQNIISQVDNGLPVDNLTKGRSSLSGDIFDGKDTYKDGVSFYLFDAKGKKEKFSTQSSKDTAIIIHGWKSSSDAMSDLAKKYAKKFSSSQVLTLDWRAPANDSRDWEVGVPFNSANAIRPVADWASKMLQDLKIDPRNITIIGHSLGAYVGSEISRILGEVTQRKVKRLVALDPAYPGIAYDIDGRNKKPFESPKDFKDVAEQSISLVVQDSSAHIDVANPFKTLAGTAIKHLWNGGIAGDNEMAKTANKSLLVDFTGGAPFKNNEDYHGAVVKVYSNIFSQIWKLPDNLKENWYSNTGDQIWEVDLIGRNDSHEGVIFADVSGEVNYLEYVSENPRWDGLWRHGPKTSQHYWS